MQLNIFELLNSLVEMSGSKSNLDELKAELKDVENKINNLEHKLDDLDEEMNDEKYFDASSEIVDRNIKISLVKKIQNLNKVKSDIEDELEEVKSSEIMLHNELDLVLDEIKAANEYNNVINNYKVNNDSYNNMIASENSRITKLLEKKETTEKEYDKVQRKVEYLSDSLSEITEKINKETERLQEVNDNLSNIKAYINTEAKEKDENKYLKLKEQLDTLIKRKNDILNDSVFISGSIKELIANDKLDEVELEFEKLIEVVKQIPYMELENEELEDEMNRLNEELSSYDKDISNKEYHNLDSEFIEERINYLEDYISRIKKEIKALKTLEDNISKVNNDLSDKIFRAEEQILKIDESLIVYDQYDYEATEIPKSVIQAANNKLNTEKDNISSIANKYREDLVINIDRLKTIGLDIEKYNSDIIEKQNEYDELNKVLALNTKSINILEEEKDKLHLEKINEKIVNLKNRQQFTKSLNDILGEFEMLKSSLEFVDKKTRNERHSHVIEEEVEEISTEDITEDITEDVAEETEFTPEVIEEEPNEVITEDDQPIINDEINEEMIPVIEEFTEEPVIIDDVTEKLRVVEIIPISEEITEKEDENEFMVNDFADEDYISFENLVTESEVDNEDSIK